MDYVKLLFLLVTISIGTGTAVFWIALSDIREEGTWIWMNSHTPLTSTAFSDWEPGQPNNYHSDENCAVLRDNGHNTWQWNDYSCHINVHYICEKSDEFINYFSNLNDRD